MLKSDLIKKLLKRYPKLNQPDMENIVELFFKKIVNSLQNNQPIEIRGFGSFKTTKVKSKNVRNPKTGDVFFKEESKKIKFKFGKTIYNKINNN